MIENFAQNQVLSVTQANLLAKELLETVPVWVEGEAFDVRQKDQRYRFSYFYLKDPDTQYQLPCIAEPYYLENLDFALKEGSKYKMYGNLTLWEKGGKYQFSVKKIEPIGEGNLIKKLEEIKKRLQDDGLFDESIKKKIPDYPENIGVITSLATGSAAWEDFRRHSVDVFPFLNLVVKDTFVQGDRAVGDLVSSIRQLDKMGLDLIVLTRGGGSMEDLMAFNSESLAREIFKAKTPILSAVGHEKDVTIADLVSDLRASTPTNAAHIVTQKYHHLFDKIDHLAYELGSSQIQKIGQYSQQLDFSFERLNRVKERIFLATDKLKDIKRQLVLSSLEVAKNESGKLEMLLTELSLLSPERTLQRGYSLVTNERGEIVKTAKNVAIGQVVNVRLARGQLGTKITKIYD